MKFEEALKKLELATELLENEDTSLENSLKNFEEGLQYYKVCLKILDDAKQRIEIYEREIEEK